MNQFQRASLQVRKVAALLIRLEITAEPLYVCCVYTGALDVIYGLIEWKSMMMFDDLWYLVSSYIAACLTSQFPLREQSSCEKISFQLVDILSLVPMSALKSIIKVDY